MDVNVIGCCTTPSKPMMVLVSCFFIVNLCTLEPRPVKVDTCCNIFWCWEQLELFWSIDFAKTVDGKIVVTTPVLAVDQLIKQLLQFPQKLVKWIY